MNQDVENQIGGAGSDEPRIVQSDPELTLFEVFFALSVLIVPIVLAVGFVAWVL